MAHGRGVRWFMVRGGQIAHGLGQGGVGQAARGLRWTVPFSLNRMTDTCKALRSLALSTCKKNYSFDTHTIESSDEIENMLNLP